MAVIERLTAARLPSPPPAILFIISSLQDTLWRVLARRLQSDDPRSFQLTSLLFRERTSKCAGLSIMLQSNPLASSPGNTIPNIWKRPSSSLGCWRSGTTATLFVHSGWVGIEDILSGADNFFLAYSPKADPAGLIEKLGERYEVTRTNIKKWRVGSPIQAPLDAMEILLKRHPFQPGRDATGHRAVGH